MTNKKSKNSFKQVICNNFYMLRYIFKYTPGLIVFNFITMVIIGIRNCLNGVYITKYILDSVQLKRSLRQVMIFILFFILFNIVDSVSSSIYDQVYLPKKKLILFQKIHTELFEKAKKVELACYDNPKFYNDFVWASSEADERALAVLENVGILIKRITNIIGVGAIIVSINIWGILIVFLSIALSFWLKLKVNKIEYEMSLQQKQIQRERDYTSRILYMPDYAKEIRLSHVKNVLIRNFSMANKKLIDVITRYGKRSVKWEVVNKNFANTFLLDGAYLAYLCYQTVVKGVFTYGSFMGLYNGVFNFKGCLEAISKVFAQLQSDSLYIERLMRFMRYEPQMKISKDAVPMPFDAGVMELNHISFQYDGNQDPTIRDISLHIKPGEKVALVGYNGAGKSTLIKLLMRLYDVTEGEIALDKIDIKQFSLQDYRKYFGVVFQDYQIFAARLSENVMMDLVQPQEEEDIKLALDHSGFTERLQGMSGGLKTMLTREFAKDGVNLSGGEAQKVAIARVFPRNCKMVILDEPSSALDPISEYNVNQSMLEAAKDKTVIFISHRLSTTRIADRIIMLEQGHIIEEGSHEELMELNGKYAQMFNMQAEKYKEDAS